MTNKTCPVCQSTEWQPKQRRYCSQTCFVEHRRRESFRRWQENREAILERMRIARLDRSSA